MVQILIIFLGAFVAGCGINFLIETIKKWEKVEYKIGSIIISTIFIIVGIINIVWVFYFYNCPPAWLMLEVFSFLWDDIVNLVKSKGRSNDVGGGIECDVPYFFF